MTSDSLESRSNSRSEQIEDVQQITPGIEEIEVNSEIMLDSSSNQFVQDKLDNDRARKEEEEEDGYGSVDEDGSGSVDEDVYGSEDGDGCGSEEEDGSGSEEERDASGQEEEEGYGTGEEEDSGSDEKKEVENENVRGQQSVEIPINGLVDMGEVNFKELTVNDLIRYHFPNREVGFLFYSWYARMHGFAARKSRTFKNMKGEVLQQSFVCFREGKRKQTSADCLKRKRFPRKDTRCSCHAHLQLHIDNEDKIWYVRSIYDEHNHTLINMSLVGLIPSHRRMNEADILQMNNMTKVGVSTPLSYGVFANQMGGYENVPFSMKNMYFEQDKQRKKDVVDARGVLSYLRLLKESDQNMFWCHTADEDGRLDKLFWCDGCSKANYSIFGDVLAFDATYKKNKYRRPLVIFSGVNHHNQTIVFASALVSNEKEETYVWLLQKFMTAMNGKAPISVITDGHVPMKHAIQKVFPRAHHRLCAWHLLRNANSNVSDPNFISKLTRCMLWDFEIGEFEEKWTEMIVECGVEDNEWVWELYERKKMWVVAHMHGEFFAGFRTTSRVEGLHAQVGKFVNSWNNLTDFMHNFNRYLSYQRFRELEADFASLHGDHVPQTQLRKLERSASNYYTNNIFKLVSRGLQRSLILRVTVYKETSTCIIYFVSKYCMSGRKWTVSWWRSGMEFKCSCLRMESHGIPCDHILAMLTFLDLVEIPKSLVLNRWTKFAKESIAAFGTQPRPWDPLTLCRFSALTESCRRMSKAACHTPEAFSETKAIVLAQCQKLEANSASQPKSALQPSIASQPNVNIASEVNDEEEEGERYLQNPPMPSRMGNSGGAMNGRGRGRRSNRCGICGVVGHNRTSCNRHTQ
ncbi:protein FAR1-RELATED SEQUENCE 5-like [Lotus japonicus]|uniref:protein FAR1-RELATED SEQUENCE 5-like n=1 Tax=Lotus japonicus TaxID=34305 RepID=UPI00258B8CC7|nr:protein FAR1-RELATED SEQUENCE 5-like [Lotus japonicus]